MHAAQLLFLIEKKMDPTHKKKAREILKRMIIQLANQIIGSTLSQKEYVYTPFKPGLEELDIDRTLENFFVKKALSLEDIVCREKVKKKKAAVLLLDVSNSMQMEKIVIATLALGVLAQKLRDDAYAVVTFRDHAQILKSINEPPSVEEVIDRFLDVEFGGSTDIRGALEIGLKEIGGVKTKERFGIIVTDGWITRGGDPTEVAGSYPKLHVIEVPLGLGGGHTETCVEIAKAGRGRHFHVQDFRDLPRTLLRLLRET